MRKRRQTRYIVVHCSATPPSSDIGADEIDDMHERRGFNNGDGIHIGYHEVILRDGTIEFGRHFDEPGAHVKGRNYQSIGICLIGGVDRSGNAEDNFTDEQMDALYVSLQHKQLAYPDAEILGHRNTFPDVNGDGIVDRTDWLKECPSFSVRDWIETYTDL